MKPADFPANENERLDDLLALQILDTPEEERFDRITRLASNMLGFPVVLVSLIDSERQWFKSRHGLDFTETPRDISFCAHAIHSEEVFVVENALEDPRFLDNPLVSGDFHLRFYAGVPLRGLKGHRIGTFCMIDKRPRILSDKELRTFHDLAALAQREIDARRLTEAIQRISEQDAELQRINIFLEAGIEERTRQLTQALNAAKAVNEEKSVFLANMSHEIRTPLHGVLATLHLALDTGPAAQGRRHVENALRAGQKLMRIVDDILDFSKMEAGKLQLENIPVDIPALLEEHAALFEPVSLAKGLQLRVKPPVNLPRGLLGDPFRLGQVLGNFIGNAVKFTIAGEVIVQATVDSETDDHAVLLFSVQDTGIGLSDDQLEKLFQSFQQADLSTSRHFGGSGLGLVICRQLAALMDGQVGVQSVQGHGSTFWFTARLAKSTAWSATSSPDHPVSQPDARTETTPILDGKMSGAAQQELDRLAGARILVVEDNDLNQEIAKAMLEMRGAIVTIAGNGKEALACCAGQEFDCVLMDIQMPVMDGYETARLLRSDPRHAVLPILAMTANAFARDRQRATAAGMNDTIAKPVSPQQLYAAVLRWLARPEEANRESREWQEAAGPASLANPPERLIDLQMLASHLGGDTERVHRFARRFLAMAKASVNDLVHACKAGDLPAIQAIGHRVKSSARTIGSHEFARFCEALEETGTHDQDLAASEELIRRLQALLPRMEAELEASINAASSANGP
jgi:signal transduction histidine kinase/DNA-binding NarL/FixJ family response regulator